MQFFLNEILLRKNMMGEKEKIHVLRLNKNLKEQAVPFGGKVGVWGPHLVMLELTTVPQLRTEQELSTFVMAPAPGHLPPSPRPQEKGESTYPTPGREWGEKESRRA